MFNNFNSQENFDGVSGVEETYSGEQEGVVDSPESQYDEEYNDFDGDGQEEVVDPQEESGEEEGFEEGENAPAVAAQGRAKSQTREDNAAARMARIHAERDADEKIARMGMKNPVTGAPIKNMAELKAFSEQQREMEILGLAEIGDDQVVGAVLVNGGFGGNAEILHRIEHVFVLVISAFGHEIDGAHFGQADEHGSRVIHSVHGQRPGKKAVFGIADDGGENMAGRLFGDGQRVFEKLIHICLLLVRSGAAS